MDLKIKSITVQLTEEQGQHIRDLIRENFVHSFPRYCQKVGISTPNFYNALNGQRPCSVEFLNKLLSGIQYEVTASDMVVQIQEMEIGEIVPNADSIRQDDVSSLNDQEEDPDIPSCFL